MTVYQKDPISTRSGRYIRQIGGYRAFVPKPLPPEPPLRIDDELLRLLSEADQALGRLDGAAEILPNPDLFVTMYVRNEAVLSSQIEGTQASLADVLEHEANVRRRTLPADVSEVANYVGAMNQGLAHLKDLPISNRLITEIHGILLKGVRGDQMSPGEFRHTQNWIGASKDTLSDAIFVPPPPGEIARTMGDLELFLNDDDAQLPVLFKCGLAHGQFETIHPFLDGNGRLGRLLITFILCQQEVLKRPLLYLSSYFKRHRDEYYDRLQAIRSAGDWEGWLKFFLKGVRDVSQEATETARGIIELREEHRKLIMDRVPGISNGLALLDHLYERPVIVVSRAQQVLGVSYVTANKLVSDLSRLSLLREMTGRPRNRVFMYEPYLNIFTRMTGA